MCAHTFPSRGSRTAIGMVHLRALPGTPHNALPLDQVEEIAVAEATSLVEAGFDALLIENMHDVPYLRSRVGPEIVSAMTRIGRSIRSLFPKQPLGVQVLAGANFEALAVAQAIEAEFIRAENFVFAAVADEGLMEEAAAGPLLRYRKAIGAEHVSVFADIKKKHSSHAITADVSLGETARAAEFAGADGVIISGASTGEATSMDDLREVRSATELPMIVGSGASAETAPALLQIADAIIVGSSLKEDGDWRRHIDPQRANAFVSSIRS